MHKLTTRIRFMVFSDNCVGLVSFSRALSWDVEAFHRVSVFFSIFLIIIWPCLKRTGKKQIQEFDVVLEGVGGGGRVKLANFSLTGP